MQGAQLSFLIKPGSLATVEIELLLSPCQAVPFPLSSLYVTGLHYFRISSGLGSRT